MHFQVFNLFTFWIATKITWQQKFPELQYNVLWIQQHNTQ